MGDNNAKLLRKQLRNVVQEILGEVLTSELVTEVEKRLVERQDARMTGLAHAIREVVAKVDERSKEVQGYLIRAATPQAPQAQDSIVPNAIVPESQRSGG